MGGNFANLSIGPNDPHVFSVNLTPKAAWFGRDNIALGGYLNLGIQTAQGSCTTTDFGIGALGRYYTGSNLDMLKHGRLFVNLQLA